MDGLLHLPQVYAQEYSQPENDKEVKESLPVNAYSTDSSGRRSTQDFRPALVRVFGDYADNIDNEEDSDLPGTSRHIRSKGA